MLLYRKLSKYGQLHQFEYEICFADSAVESGSLKKNSDALVDVSE